MSDDETQAIIDELDPTPAAEALPVSRRQALRALAGVGALGVAPSGVAGQAGTVRAEEAFFSNYRIEQTAAGVDLIIDGQTFSFDGDGTIELPDGGQGTEVVTPSGTTASEVVDENGEVVWTPPAFFELNSVSSNTPVSPGDDLDISAEITNTGDGAGEQTVETDATALGLAGDAVKYQSVDLNAGESRTYLPLESFSSIEPSQSGEVVVSTDDDTAPTFVEVESGSAILDSFEDQDLTEYGGDTGAFSIVNSRASDGTYSLQSPSTGTSYIGSTSGLDAYPDVGDTHYIDFWFPSGTGDFDNYPAINIIFGHDSSTASSNGYLIKPYRGDNSGNLNEELRLRRLDGGSENQIAVSPASIPTEEWLTLEILHESNGTLTVTLFNSSGSELASVSATDTTHLTDGSYDATGIGFLSFRTTEEYIDNWRIGGGIGQAQTEYFAANGVEQPFGENHRPEGLYNSTTDKSFIIYAGQNLDPYAVEYDHGTGEWTAPAQVGTNQLSVDSHGIPSMIQDSGGVLHAFYGVHGENGELNHATTDSANDATSWTEQSNITGNCTYPAAFNVDGDLYTILRLYNAGEKNQTGYIVSTDDGSTWSAKTPLVTMSTDSWPYHFGGEKDGTDIHLCIVRNNRSDGTLVNVYHCIFDTAAGTMLAADGTDLGGEITDTELENNCLAFDSGAEQTGPASLTVDGNGNPHIVFTHDNGGSWEWRYTRWDGTTWTTPQTITGKGSQNSAAAMKLTSASDITVWLPTNVPAGERDGDIERWEYDGSDWTMGATVYAESDWSVGAGSPHYIRNAASDLQVGIPQIDVGDYTNADLKLFAHGSNGYVKND